MPNLVKLHTKLEFVISKKLVHRIINMVVPLFLLAGFLLQLIVFHKMIGLIPKVVQNFGSVLILEIVAIRYCDC